MTTRRIETVPVLTAATVACAAILALGACSGDTSGPDGEFTITPDGAEILIGESVQFSAIGAPSTPMWSSSNSQIAAVTPETGFVVGVSHGTATVSAVAGSAVASVSVTVLRSPAIALGQPTVDFFMDVAGSNPSNQTVQVTNAGDRTLSGVTVQGITYGPNNPGPWLTVNASGDTAPLTLTLAADGQSLPRGVYTATVQVAAPGVDNSPQSLAVMLHVQAPAEIAVSRNVVPMAGIVGAAIDETVQVTNAGDKTLDGLTVEVRDPPGNPPGGWLTASLDATVAPTTLRLTASTQNLPVGGYTTIVRVASGVAGVAPVDITVDLTVSPGPAIALASTTASFQATTGQNPANQSVEITNGGGGSLTDLSLGTITYAGGQAGWLTATLTGTTAPASITLIVASASLPQGSYTATVPVQSPVASNSPLALEVRLNVGPPPIISLNPPTLVFSGWSGGSPPPAQAIQVTNGAAGGGPLTGLSYSISYGAGASGWLNAGWLNNNTSAPAILLVAPNTGTLPRGVYTATITVSTSMQGVAAKSVTVTYTVNSFTVDIDPNMATNFGACSGCHSGGQPPNLSGGALAKCAALTSGYVVPGNPSGSVVYQKISGSTSHAGGTNGFLAGLLFDWISRNAPCS